MSKLIILVAMDEGRVIGKNGKIPWRLSSDLKRFRSLTSGYPVIMGRNTFESIGKPLPGRENIILTRDKEFKRDGCYAVGSLKEALDLVASFNKEKIFIIGGGQVYKETLPFADEIELTLVDARLDGDTFFPEIKEIDWEEMKKEKHQADSENEYDYQYITYNKKRPK